MPNAPVTLAITGMTCGRCVATVQTVAAAIPGVAVAHVAIGSAQLDIDSATPERVVGEVIDAIARAGYDATVGEPLTRR